MDMICDVSFIAAQRERMKNNNTTDETDTAHTHTHTHIIDNNNNNNNNNNNKRTMRWWDGTTHMTQFIFQMCDFSHTMHGIRFFRFIFTDIRPDFNAPKSIVCSNSPATQNTTNNQYTAVEL
jgi:hypothetical protein